MTRVAIYARVSTSKQETANQVRELEAYAARRGWTVSHRFLETAPGWEPDRERLQQLYSYAYRHEFDVVLVWALDRFSRQGVGATLSLISRLREYGIPLVSYREEFLSGMDPRVAELVASVLSWVAQQEHLRISDRTKAGLARARAAGRQPGRERKYAFDADAARALRAKGHSWRGVLRQLDLPREALSSVRRVCQKGGEGGSGGRSPVPGGVP